MGLYIYIYIHIYIHLSIYLYRKGVGGGGGSFWRKNGSENGNYHVIQRVRLWTCKVTDREMEKKIIALRVQRIIYL